VAGLINKTLETEEAINIKLVLGPNLPS